MAPQGTNDDRGSAEPKKHVKRPMNSYMLFRQARAPGIRTENPKLKNGDVSKEVGREWWEMPKVEKEAWKAKAEEVKRRFERHHPDYKYRPQRSANKKGKKPTSRGSTENAKDTTNPATNSSPGGESWLMSTPANPHAAAWALYGSTKNVEIPHGRPLPLPHQAPMGQFGNVVMPIAQMAQGQYGSPLTSTPQVPQGQGVQGQTAQGQISPINFGLPRGYVHERQEYSHMNMDPFLLNSGVNDPLASRDDVLDDLPQVSSPTIPLDISHGPSSLGPSSPEQTDQHEFTPTNRILPYGYANTSSGIASQTDLDEAILNDSTNFDSFTMDLDLSLLDWEPYYPKEYF
ncbi:hypothetical protein DL765_003038 [Monosporascus sp. GIB2]|nr:hypothetical protein DL765_003038 [Monosporascus sp. GIB2]